MPPRLVATLALASLCLFACHRETAPQDLTSSAPETAGEKPAMPSIIDFPIRFENPAFTTKTFPTCDFADPVAARNVIGPYTLKTTFYNAAGEVVARPTESGRYAAIVEIHHGNFISKRFATLCKDPDAADPEIVTARAAELAPRVDHRHSFPHPSEKPDAVQAAGLADLTALEAAGKPLPTDTLINLDRQWWVTFKRHYYGTDKIYTRPFISPKPLAGKPARTLEPGSLEQAGMKPDAIANIDKTCQAWAGDQHTGLSLCVVRHGILVLNHAYGIRTAGPLAGTPFLPDSVTELASASKFLSAVLFAEFAAQGLVNIDDPIDKYLPTLANIHVKRVPTFRECYLHTAGFDGHWGDRSNDMEELLADIYPTLEVAVRQKYQGVGHALAGKVMESISGDSIPRLFQKHLLDPLQCTHTRLDLTSFGNAGTSLELAIIAQMMLNGGSYGNLQFTTPEIIRQMQPVPGNDRFDPDKTIRWGVGIKMFDSDGMSPQTYGASGALGALIRIDPSLDLVITMVRDKEGDKYLKNRAAMIQSILAEIDPAK